VFAIKTIVARFNVISEGLSSKPKNQRTGAPWAVFETTVDGMALRRCRNAATVVHRLYQRDAVIALTIGGRCSIETSGCHSDLRKPTLDDQLATVQGSAGAPRSVAEARLTPVHVVCSAWLTAPRRSPNSAA
jgi:hypothetical protein